MSTGSVSVVELEAQLRQAEARRADAERQYAEALSNSRSATSTDPLEARQSKVRELEKMVALETVRVEELQLELASTRRTTSAVGIVTATTTTSTQWQPKTSGTEIERLLKKIELDNIMLAELDHSRSTTLSAPECQWGMSAPPSGASSLDPTLYGNSAVSAPVSPLPSANMQGLSSSTSTYQYAPSSLVNTSSYLHQPQFTSSTAGGYLHQIPSSNLQQSVVSNNVMSLANQVNSYTNQSASSAYVNPIPSLTNQMNQIPYSNVMTSALNQQSSVFSQPSTAYGNSVGITPFNVTNTTFSNPLTSTLTSTLGYTSLTNPTSAFSNNVSFSNPLASANWCSPAMNVKLKPLEEAELGRRVPTPVTPHAPGVWDRLASRPAIPIGLAENSGDWGVTDGQVDMLDIPGKGRCSVYIARFSYDPEPDAPEDELAIAAGDYLLVWSEPGASYLDAELLDGRRGLVPAHFAQRLIGDDLLDFHQAVLSSLRDEESAEILAADVQRLCEIADIHDDVEDDTIDAQGNMLILIDFQSYKCIKLGYF